MQEDSILQTSQWLQRRHSEQLHLITVKRFQKWFFCTKLFVHIRAALILTYEFSIGIEY